MELRRSTRIITPSLKALEAAENAKCFERSKRVRRYIASIPDSHMNYVESQLQLLTAQDPMIDQIDHLSSILSACGFCHSS